MILLRPAQQDYEGQVVDFGFLIDGQQGAVKQGQRIEASR
jgi:hypothetical protein